MKGTEHVYDEHRETGSTAVGCGRSTARKFHARNCYQVLGKDLQSPSNFVLCWTPGGAVTGGTGQALRIAIDRGIPVFNMGAPEWDVTFDQWMKEKNNA